MRLQALPSIGTRLMLAAGLVAAVAIGVTERALPSCPTNQIVVSGVTVNSSAASLDTTVGLAHGAYDLASGTLACSVDFSNPGWVSSTVDTDDEYWIVGGSPGTPLDFGVELTVSGHWNVYPGVPQGDCTFGASIASDGASDGFFVGPGSCCHNTVAEIVRLDLRHAPGEPFRLQLHLASSDQSGHVDLSGALIFTGLPAGTAVVSCQGYSPDPTVAVEPPTSSARSLAFARVTPNPTAGDPMVALHLPSAAPAKLELFDTAGRRVTVSDLGGIGDGDHTVRLRLPAGLAAGVYVLRLTQAGRSAARSLAVVR